MSQLRSTVGLYLMCHDLAESNIGVRPGKILGMSFIRVLALAILCPGSTVWEKKPLIYLLIACAAGSEVLFFGALIFLKPENFIKIVWHPDTSSYVRIAQKLTQRRSLITSYRTLGYPLFMSLGYMLGGQDYGNYLIIGGQLILNLLFTWGFWKLLERMCPSAPARIRVLLTLFFFWAGLGMALKLLTDFLAAFLFGVFLFGFLFWRSGLSLFVSAMALGLATLVRPTFTFVPLLIPIAAYLVERCTSKLPVLHVVGFVFASLAATGMSSVYQYSFQGYAGPSPILAKNIGRTLDVISRVGSEENEPSITTPSTGESGNARESPISLSRPVRRKDTPSNFSSKNSRVGRAPLFSNFLRRLLNTCWHRLTPR